VAQPVDIRLSELELIDYWVGRIGFEPVVEESVAGMTSPPGLN
jgi:hypothetical protein